MTSRPLTESEINLVLSHLSSPRDRALFVTGVKTGFRISEILSLRVSDIMKDGKIMDTITVHRRNMKGKRSSRSVPLHPQAKEALAAYILPLAFSTGICSSPQRLFPMTRQHAWRIISGAAEKAGLSGTISTHSLRKTFAQRIYAVTNKDVVATQIALGHKSLQSTTHYLGVGQDVVDDAILKA